jgi:hypothetical protein
VVIAAKIFGAPQVDIPDDAGRAHAAAFRDRQTGHPLPAGQELHQLLGTPMGLPNQPQPLSDGDLRLRLCSPDAVSDAVAVVRVVGRRAFLTDDSSFVFTVYRAKLLRVIKPSDTVAPSMGTITFARPGGNLMLADGSRNVRLDTFPSLQAGHVYILGLRARGDVLVAENSSLQFRLVDDRAQTMGDREDPADSPSVPDNELEQSLAVLSGSPCNSGEVVR